MPGHSDHAAAEHILHGTSAGEGGFWDVLSGCRTLSLLLLVIPHGLLPLRESVQNILKVSLYKKQLFAKITVN